MHDSGEGPALLLLHAYPLDASQWDAQVAALSDRYRCLRPDFWGCGSSPPPPEQVSIDSYARDVLGELDRAGIGEFAVCSSSMGGYTAFALLRAARERVRGLVLAGTRAAADSVQTRQARATVADQVRAGGVEAIVEQMTHSLLCARCRDEVHIADPVRGRIRRWTVEGVLTMLQALAERPDSTSMLAAIDVPTLVIYGSADVIVPPDESRAMAAAIPRAEVAEFASAAHLANLEQPQAFSHRTGAFLDARLQPQ
jgi:3-oxoadipate enol-lactonase